MKHVMACRYERNILICNYNFSFTNILTKSHDSNIFTGLKASYILLYIWYHYYHTIFFIINSCCTGTKFRWCPVIIYSFLFVVHNSSFDKLNFYLFKMWYPITHFQVVELPSNYKLLMVITVQLFNCLKNLPWRLKFRNLGNVKIYRAHCDLIWMLKF